MEIIHYLNGRFVAEEELLISPRDLGFTRGYAVFDFFRTYNGHRPFMFDAHIARLFRSADQINLSLPWSKNEIKDLVIKTLAKNNLKTEFAVKIIISGGLPAPASIQPVAPSLIIMLDRAIDFPSAFYKTGIKAITAHYKRSIPTSKTTQYIEAIINFEKMTANDATDILYVHKGLILEGAFSNFFCVIDNKIVTPKKEILEGITRKVILERLHIELPLEIRDLRLEEINSASEAFMSVTGKGIVPVTEIDGREIGNGRVGPVAENVIQEFNRFVAST